MSFSFSVSSSLRALFFAAASPGRAIVNLIHSLRVEDKVTNLGIIGLISYYEKKNMIIISDFLFSCRALGRDLEKYFIVKIVNKLLYLNKKIKFNFKKTSKNQLCTEILNKLKIEMKSNYK